MTLITNSVTHPAVRLSVQPTRTGALISQTLTNHHQCHVESKCDCQQNVSAALADQRHGSQLTFELKASFIYRERAQPEEASCSLVAEMVFIVKDTTREWF